MIVLRPGTKAVVTNYLGDKTEVEVVAGERSFYGFVTYWVRYDDRDGLYPFMRDDLAALCNSDNLLAAIADDQSKGFNV